MSRIFGCRKECVFYGVSGKSLGIRDLALSPFLAIEKLTLRVKFSKTCLVFEFDDSLLKKGFLCVLF